MMVGTTNASKGTTLQTPEQPQRTRVAGYQVICLPTFKYLYEGKGDDRIFSGMLSRHWPAVIVADGASERIDETSGAVVAGGGAQAAEVVVEVARCSLDKLLRRPRNLKSVLQHLREVYKAGVEQLREKDISSATTLLIALLYKINNKKGDQSAFWFYAFEGDGAIVLINPKRKIDGRLIRSELLVPGQKMDATATVSRKGTTVPPIVGCILYEPGDIVYVASDGMAAVENALVRDKRIFLANYLWNNLCENQDAVSLNSALSGFRFSDDAVLG